MQTILVDDAMVAALLLLDDATAFKKDAIVWQLLSSL